MGKTVLTLMAAAIALAGTSFAADKTKQIPGADILEKRCSTCHPSARPKGLKKNAAQWEATVTRMMAKGAKLSADEKKTLIDHLAKTYKP